MNHLGHFALCGLIQEPSEIFANRVMGVLLGDFIKGSLSSDINTAWQPYHAGIQFHRNTDAFVDRCPNIRTIAQFCPQSTRRYSAILIDLLNDYCISHHWQQYHTEDFYQWRQNIYHALEQQQSSLPNRPESQQLKNFTERLIRFDTLGHYHHPDTLFAACKRISSRLKRPVDLVKAMEKMLRFENEIFLAFNGYYPDVISWAKEYHSR